MQKVTVKSLKCFHKNIFLGNNWNITKEFSIKAKSYQQCPTFIWIKYMLLCKVIYNLFVVYCGSFTAMKWKASNVYKCQFINIKLVIKSYCFWSQIVSGTTVLSISDLLRGYIE